MTALEIVNELGVGFYDLEEGKRYLQYFKGRDSAFSHNYIYELKEGRLFNITRDRFSNLPFNKSVYFVESMKNFRVPSLEFDVELSPIGAKIGCQTITKNDLLLLCDNIRSFYE